MSFGSLSAFTLVIYNYARQRTPNLDDATDAARDAIAEAIAKNNFDLPWAKAIVRRRLVDIQRRRAREICFDFSGMPLPIGLLTDDSLPGMRAEHYDRTRNLILKCALPARQEEALLLRLDEWEAGEIAERMKISVRRVWELIDKAIRNVQKHHVEDADWFHFVSKVSLKHSVVSVASLMRLQLHRNPRNG